MMPVTRSSEPNRSCWSATKDCLQRKETIPLIKFSALFIGAPCCILIPVPFLNGALTGSGVFLMLDTAIQFTYYRKLNRNWKQLTLGTLISGAGTGLGSLLASPPLFSVELLGGLVGGLAIGLFATYYSNYCFNNNYRPVEQTQSLTAAGTSV